ncbi:flippase-like domain-containing protein [Blastococcus sp. KM273129]|nr:flippase-like domain-containing protein [Blastococcus sp. KM273129]
MTMSPPADRPQSHDGSGPSRPTARLRTHSAGAPLGRVSVGRVILLLLFGVSLYLLAPQLADMLASWPQLSDIAPWWFAAVATGQVLSVACLVLLQRMALRTSSWFSVTTSQVASNAFSRVVPGGAAAGAALQFRMLGHAGIDGPTAVTGLAALSLLQTASVLALPVLALPALIAGVYVPRALLQSAVLGGIAFAVVVAVGAVLMTADRSLTALARAAQSLHNRVAKRRPPVTGLPKRLLDERNAVRSFLGSGWWKALLTTAGKLGFDYLSLLAALAATGSRPRPSLVLLAFASALLLGMIPITPGGLGFVEAGLYGTLTLAGVATGDALLATLVYRLASYWLPILAGPIAYVLFRRRYGSMRSTTG